MFQLDRSRRFAIALIGARARCSRALLSMHYLAELRINHGEYYALILFATVRA